MKRFVRRTATTVAILAPIFAVNASFAQEAGGILRVYHRDNPPSASIHEEATNSTVQPFMAVFNKLVHFDQHSDRNSPDGIVPDPANEWARSEDRNTEPWKPPDGEQRNKDKT